MAKSYDKVSEHTLGLWVINKPLLLSEEIRVQR